MSITRKRAKRRNASLPWLNRHAKVDHETFAMVANLIEGIHQTFTTPELWPLNEAARNEFMRRMWQAAKNIRSAPGWKKLAEDRHAATGRPDLP